MPEEHKTVFISYRRKVAAFIARAIFQDLRDHEYDVFMDVESIDSGQFNQIILNQIEAKAHFILILTSGTVERCAEPGDWLRQEIEYAIDKQRNIVPLLINDYNFDDAKPYLTGKLAQLPTLQRAERPARLLRCGDGQAADTLLETAGLRRDYARARQRSAGSAAQNWRKSPRSPHRQNRS